MKIKRLLLSSLGIFLVLISFVSAHTGDDNSAHHSMMGNSGIGMMWFGWVFSILVAIVLVLLIIWLVKQIQKNK